MTTAPQELKDSRALLLEHLGPHGLDPLEVGIVGDTAHVSEGDSYHLGLNEQRYGGYSGGGESSRDKAGLCEFASALDIGTFSATTAKGTFDHHHLGRWVAGECAAGAPDTKDIREIIYSPDGKTVKRWDRLGIRSSGDSSHLSHDHLSVFRDATKAGRGLVPLFTRYLIFIGILEGPDAMPTVQEIWTSTEADLITRYNPDGSPVGGDNPYMTAGYALGYAVRLADAARQAASGARNDLSVVRAELAALRTVVDTLAETLRAGGGSVDTTSIFAKIDAAVEAIRAEMRDAVADLGEGGSAQVRADQ